MGTVTCPYAFSIMNGKEEKEIWKEIDGFPDYEVSNLGRVCSFKGRYPRILKLRKSSSGYLQVILCMGGKMIGKTIHRLVAESFVPNPENKPQVNHIDEDKKNNVAENLEWVTRKENCNHGTRNKRVAETKGKVVVQYTTGGFFMAEYPSIMEAGRVTGIAQSSICQVCRGKRKTAGGYIWCYEEGGETC